MRPPAQLVTPAEERTGAAPPSTVAGGTLPVLGPAYGRAAARTRSLTPEQREIVERIKREDSAEDYESVDCLCGAAGEDSKLTQVDRYGLPCTFLLCNACGLIRQSPRWTEARFRRFYELEYRAIYSAYGPKEPFARRIAEGPTVRDIAAWIGAAQARHGRPVAQPTIVEVGAGGGWNLSRLPADWERIGYDVDEEYLSLGARLFGVTMKPGFLDETLQDVARADLVLLSHVVEHFSDPVGMLRRIRGVMKPDALLLVEVPGIFRIHRSNLDVMSYIQSAHTYTFSAATLRAACTLAGYDVVAVDETVRAVCRPSSQGGPRIAARDASLPALTLRYLRACEFGYRTFLRLRSTPGAGRYISYLWKRAYFPLLATLVPKG